MSSRIWGKIRKMQVLAGHWGGHFRTTSYMCSTYLRNGKSAFNHHYKNVPKRTFLSASERSVWNISATREIFRRELWSAPRIANTTTCSANATPLSQWLLVAIHGLDGLLVERLQHIVSASIKASPAGLVFGAGLNKGLHPHVQVGARFVFHLAVFCMFLVKSLPKLT